MTLTVLLLIGYLALFRWATETLLKITFSFVVFLLITNYAVIIIYVNTGTANYYVLIIDIFVTFILGLMMYAYAKTDNKMISKVIKESCQWVYNVFV